MLEATTWKVEGMTKIKSRQGFVMCWSNWWETDIERVYWEGIIELDYNGDID